MVHLYPLDDCAGIVTDVGRCSPAPAAMRPSGAWALDAPAILW